MSPLTSSSPVPAARPRRLGAILALMAFAVLILGIDVYIVVVALPEIGRELGFSDQTLQSVISSYAVTFGGFLLFGGRASDLLGRRRMFVLGMALFGLASLTGGLAGSPEQLIVARAVQGIGGALLFPSTLALIGTLFAEGAERNRALSVWSGAGAGGLVLGSLLGGVLTHAFGWEAIFLVNVPLAALALLLAFPLIPADGARERGRTFDLPGALAATTGTMLLVFGLIQAPEAGWGAPHIVASLLAGAALLAGFFAIERRGRDPLIPLRLLANRNLATGATVGFMQLATFGSILYFLTLYFQDEHGYDALETGLAFLLPTAFILLGSGSGGRLATRFGLRATLAVSLAVATVGAVAIALTMSADASYAALIPGLILLSIGDGVVYTAMFIAAGTGVAERDQGVASGIASTGTQVGSVVGLAVLVAVANSGGLRTGTLVAAAGIALTILVALNLRAARSGGSEPAPVPGYAGAA